jgi:hypothetical protein
VAVQEVAEAHRPELVEAKTKYVREHPETAADPH